IARKLAGPEKSSLADADAEFHLREYVRLRAEVEAAHRDCKLPDGPTARPALNDLLVRLRVGAWSTPPPLIPSSSKQPLDNPPLRHQVERLPLPVHRSQVVDAHGVVDRLRHVLRGDAAVRRVRRHLVTRPVHLTAAYPAAGEQHRLTVGPVVAARP